MKIRSFLATNTCPEIFAGWRPAHCTYALGALIMIFCVILSGECRADYPAPNIASVYYSATDNPFANSTDYNVGQCTWYVYGRIQETGLITNSKLSSLGFFTGGADTWYANAISAAGIAAGFTTGSQPKTGAIACWNTGSIKHVAFVENTSGTYGQMTESNLMPNKAPSYSYPGYPVVIDGVETISQNYVWLHSSMSASVSTRIWQIPQFTKVYVTGSEVYDGTYWWFPLSAQDGNPNHTGYAALLDANTGVPVLADDITLNFTCVQLTAGTPWIASAPTYIYLPTTTLPAAFTKQSPPNNTTPVTSQNVTLSWNPSSGGNITYDVTLNGENSVLIQSWSGVTATSVSGTIPNTYGANYYWQVTAVNSAGSTAADGGNWWEFWAELLDDLTISATSLTLPATAQGTAGGTATFSVSAVGLSSVDYLTLTAPSGCEVSLNGLSFAGTQLLYPDANGNISTTTVYGRITAAATASVSGSLTIQGHSKTSLLKSIQVSGTVTALSPPSITSVSQVIGSNSKQTVTINGANFAEKPAITLTWPGQPNYPLPAAYVTFVNANQLQTSILTGTQPSGWTVQATNPDHQPSGAFPFQVNAPMPVITGISPTSINAGSGDISLTVNGTTFDDYSIVEANGNSLATTAHDNAAGLTTSLTATLPASYLTSAGNITIKVNTPSPGGGLSGGRTFTVNGAQTPILAVTPPTVAALPATAGTLTFNVSNANAANSTMNYSATATSDGSWLHVSSGGTGGNGGTLVVNYDQNNTGAQCSGTIQVTASGASGSPILITVIQAAASSE